MAITTTPLNELAHGSPDADAPNTKRQRCILLIEDNQDAMLLVERALGKYEHGKYRLEWAKCLHDGLIKIENGGIDLVVLDLGLPDSPSSRSYSWVRKVAAGVPIVILTGESREENRSPVPEGDPGDYLLKGTASGAALVRAITAALERSEHAKQESYDLI